MLATAASIFGIIGSFFSAVSEFRQKRWVMFVIKTIIFLGALFMFFHADDQKGRVKAG